MCRTARGFQAVLHFCYRTAGRRAAGQLQHTQLVALLIRLQHKYWRMHYWPRALQYIHRNPSVILLLTISTPQVVSEKFRFQRKNPVMTAGRTVPRPLLWAIKKKTTRALRTPANSKAASLWSQTEACSWRRWVQNWDSAILFFCFVLCMWQPVLCFRIGTHAKATCKGKEAGSTTALSFPQKNI